MKQKSETKTNSMTKEGDKEMNCEKTKEMSGEKSNNLKVQEDNGEEKNTTRDDIMYYRNRSVKRMVIV